MMLMNLDLISRTSKVGHALFRVGYYSDSRLRNPLRFCFTNAGVEMHGRGFFSF